uniref:Dynein heavy chain linker domain-containing protein n=1 Tax=Clytia hemisphaerica TaxID=252671 RepID=A0A7M5WW14_9CNID
IVWVKEIRNRHWLQVMHVTKKSFQLEANIFKLKFILDIDLLKHRDAIEEILCGSKAELELEMKLRHIEEEWTEQILKFQSFKSRGLVLFDQDHMNHLLDTLGDAKTTLSAMLTSKYVKPLREEAATWSLKLDEVSEVLEE